MWGFSKKRFFVTLGLSILVWVTTTIVQAYLTFAKYVGTFSTGCKATGYPIDVCMIPGPYIPSEIIILINIIIWFWLLHFIWKWVIKRQK